MLKIIYFMAALIKLSSSFISNRRRKRKVMKINGRDDVIKYIGLYHAYCLSLIEMNLVISLLRNSAWPWVLQIAHQLFSELLSYVAHIYIRFSLTAYKL